MAVPTGTFQAHTAIGNREDLSDIIADISPMDTPFLSNISSSSARAVFSEWQTDALDSATNQSVIEGDDPSTNTAVPTVRLGNYAQLMDKVARVSTTQRSVTSAGRGDELSYQVVSTTQRSVTSAGRGDELSYQVAKRSRELNEIGFDIAA
jgi:hypothetical protein